MFGPKYGTLTPWDQRMHRFDTAGYPRARLILEAQATLMQFLQRCVSILLRDMASVDASGASKWHETINSGLKMTGDSAIWSSYVHRPFTGPPRLNTSSLLASAKARLDSSSDHLWLLQTEPAYLKRYLRNLGQMTTIQEGMSNEIANGIINGQVHDDIVTHGQWHATVLEFEHLHELYRRYEDSITPGSPLPHKVDNALGALEVWLVNRLHSLAKSLGETPCQRPGFRHLYTNIVSPVKRTDRVVHTKSLVKEEYLTVENGLSTGSARAYRDERIWWVLTQLQGPPDSETRLRYDMLLAMLDDHLNICSKSERARLDGFLYEKLSDFVVVLDLLSTIRMHRPRNSNRAVTDCLRTEDRLAWCMAASNAISSPEYDGVYEETSLLRTFRATSSPSGPRNKQWLQQYDALHNASQRYWRKISTGWQAWLTHKGFVKVDIDLQMQPLLHWEAPDYVARLNLKREQILHDLQKPKIPESEYTFLPLCPATRNRPEYDPSSPRVKIKTQGVPPVHLHEGEIEDTPNPLPEAKVITVSKRALAIFRCMFPEQREERQKNIDWNAFVDSMVEAGFFARNGGGSIVVFEDKSGHGKIIFHRPHPEPSIDPIMLQSMGRRMNKWFDWTRETFSLARK